MRLPAPIRPAFFLAGDARANEQPGLTALHTLFVREHNRLAEEIASRDFAGQDLTDPAIDEAIYQQARLPYRRSGDAGRHLPGIPARVLGPNQLQPYAGYDASVNPSIANMFSGALYRVGHTMLPAQLMRMEDDGNMIDAGHIGLSDAFLQPELVSQFGIDPYLMGLCYMQIEEIDSHVVDQVRNMLFAPPAQFDLAAINMQRGRDHGLPDYNQTRVNLGLAPPSAGFAISPRIAK